MPGHVFSERAFRIFKLLKEKAFGIKDLKKIDPSNVRQLRYWISLGLITGEKKSDISGIWDKFNFFEFIWIMIIKELKELNFSNEIIYNCATEIFTRKDKGLKMLEFEKALLYLLTNRKEVFFSINKLGEFQVYRPGDLIQIATRKDSVTHIVMNLEFFTKEFLSRHDFFQYIKDHELLKDSELKGLEILYSSKKAKVNIQSEGEEISFSGEESVPKFINQVFKSSYKSISIHLT